MYGFFGNSAGFDVVAKDTMQSDCIVEKGVFFTASGSMLFSCDIDFCADFSVLSIHLARDEPLRGIADDRDLLRMLFVCIRIWSDQVIPLVRLGSDDDGVLRDLFASVRREKSFVVIPRSAVIL